jgi:hypothetical protein
MAFRMPARVSSRESSFSRRARTRASYSAILFVMVPRYALSLHTSFPSSSKISFPSPRTITGTRPSCRSFLTVLCRRR